MNQDKHASTKDTEDNKATVGNNISNNVHDKTKDNKSVKPGKVSDLKPPIKKKLKKLKRRASK